jgi:hypothetical protein
LPNVQVIELEISYVNNKLWAATYGRGLWKSDLYSYVGIDEEARMDNVIIYPNPSNGLFIMQLESINEAKLEIYNVMGEKVVDMQIVSTKTILDLQSYSKGIYFAKVATNKGSCVKKIIVK